MEKQGKTFKIIAVILGLIVVVAAIYMFINNKSNGKMIELTFKEYSEKVENKDSFILFIWQTGCSHCESFEPVLKRVVNKYELEIYTINLANLSDAEYSKIQNKTFISGTPTTIYIKDGLTQSTKLIGNKPEAKIIDFFQEYNFIK